MKKLSQFLHSTGNFHPVCLRPAVHSTLVQYFVAKVPTKVQQWCKLIVGDPCLFL